MRSQSSLPLAEGDTAIGKSRTVGVARGAADSAPALTSATTAESFPASDRRVTVVISASPLDERAATAAVADPRCGAISSFAGTTRDSFAGRAVVKLEYEAHERLALAEMRRIVAETVDASGGGLAHVYVAHRVGDVPVGETSVLIAASAPHRGPALAAACSLIDAIKARVPIWKREWYAEGAEAADGSAYGVAPDACDGGASFASSVGEADASAVNSAASGAAVVGEATSARAMARASINMSGSPDRSVSGSTRSHSGWKENCECAWSGSASLGV